MKNPKYYNMSIEELTKASNKIIDKKIINKRNHKEIHDHLTKLFISLPVISLFGILFQNPIIMIPLIIKYAIPLYAIIITHLFLKDRKIKKDDVKLSLEKENINMQIDNIISMNFEKKRIKKIIR